MIRRVGLVALAAAGAAAGVLAEQEAYPWRDLGGWLPDLLAGWVPIGCGIALLALRGSGGAAALLLAAGFTWFAFNFDASGPGATQWLAAHAAYLHRGPLLALALAAPDGRPRSRLARGGVVLAWLAAVLWPLWDRDGSALVLCAVFVGIAAVTYARAPGGRSRSVAGRSLAAAAVLCAAIAADALGSLAGAPQSFVDATVGAYAAAVTIAAILLFGAALLDAPSSLAERAVALERRGSTLRDALRDLLGDPALELAFADTDRDVGDATAVRAVTPVVVRGERVALISHDPRTLEDERTRSAVLAAVGLAAERARLTAEVERQVDAVEASQQRLLRTEEDERRRLAERLDRGPGVDLAAVERLVRELRLEPEPGRDPAFAGALDRAAQQLAGARPELDALVRGLGGVEPGGLAPALERLAAALPVATELELATVAVPADVGSVLWFVCSESLANAVKHAGARSVRIALTAEDGLVRLAVTDDGRGGADPRGSGLAGLAERVATLDGRLQVTSPAGGGTIVVAELPL